MSFSHIPVFKEEFLKFFEGLKLKIFFDATLGAGGHAEAILEAHPEIELLIGCDKDSKALKISKERLRPFQSKVDFVCGSFAMLDTFLEERKIKAVDGFFFDLGVSSMQLADVERGFSFKLDSPLDMRMEATNELTAFDVVNTFPEKELARIFKEYGEEPRYRQAARAIVIARSKKRLKTTKDLVLVIQPVVFGRKHLHPATRVFQALRIYVNDELGDIEKGVKKAISHLAFGGRIGVISFHSLEDRLVKNSFREACKNGELTILTKKPMVPSLSEMKANPRSRSAKLRFGEKNG